MRPLRHFRYIATDKASMLLEQLSSSSFSLVDLKLALELPFLKFQGEIGRSREPVRQALKALRMLEKSGRLKSIDEYNWPGQESFFKYHGMGLDEAFTGQQIPDFPGFYLACAAHKRTMLVLVGSLKNMVGYSPHPTDLNPITTNPLVSALLHLFWGSLSFTAQKKVVLESEDYTLQYLSLWLAERLTTPDGLHLEMIFKIVAEFDLSSRRLRWHWPGSLYNDGARKLESFDRMLIGTPLFTALQ